jgi:hypothetical protein
VSGASPGTTDGMDYRSMIVNIFGAEIMCICEEDTPVRGKNQ